MPQDYCQICGEIKGVKYCDECDETLCPRCHNPYAKGMQRAEARRLAERMNR